MHNSYLRTERQTDKQTDNNGTSSSQGYLPVDPTGPGESGKSRGPGGRGFDTELGGPTGPGSTRCPGTPGAPGKLGMLVAPDTPASPRTPRGPFAPENSVNFTLSVFRFYNSNIGITSNRALAPPGACAYTPICQLSVFQFM